MKLDLELFCIVIAVLCAMSWFHGTLAALAIVTAAFCGGERE